MRACDITLAPRAYDVDHCGEVGLAALARIFEHGRWVAVDRGALGLDELARPEAGSMVVRAQQILLKEVWRWPQPAVQRLVILGAGRRSSLVMGQELIREEDGVLLATARVLGVYLGSDGRPAELPERLRAAAEGRPAPPVVAGDMAPPEGDPPSQVMHVRPDDIDRLGHVNQARYLDLALGADDSLRRRVGDEGLLDTWRLCFAALEHRAAAWPGDVVRVALWEGATAPRPGRRERCVAMVRAGDGDILAYGRLGYTARRED